MAKPVIRLSETGNFLMFNLYIRYDDILLEVNPGEKISSVVKNGKRKKIRRDVKLEQQVFDQIASLHPAFNPKTALDYYFLPGEKVMEDGWFFDFYEYCQKNKIEIEGLDSLKKIRYKPIRPQFTYHVSTGINWFEMEVQLKYGEEEVPFKNLQKAIEKNQDFVQLKDGSLGIIPKKWLDKWILAVAMGDLKSKKLRLPKTHFLLIEKLFRQVEGNQQKIPQEVEKVKEVVQSFSKIREVKVPGNIKATLRDYQKSGFSWMVFLSKMSWGGCLADDMGLGKTLQMLTFLSWLKRRKKGKVQFLLVCPTTLLFNWQDEIQRFCLDLKYLMHWGTARSSDTGNWRESDLIMTSYGTLINDIEFLQEHHFDCVILDESQAIKNPNSLRYKAVRLIQADYRFALSGTPIENSIMELYSQMQFLNPGVLGSASHFRKSFVQNIDKDQDPELVETLKSLIKPFILRRTKEQVAKELPPKTEMILYCEMGEEQAKIYDQYRLSIKENLMANIEREGLKNVQMHVLAGITRLRQIANAPALLGENKFPEVSIKSDELLRHIREKTGEHKILVFSQFVKMLSLIRKKLTDANISFAYLDGQTRDRQAAVKTFREDPDCRVFLISLKAGGFGLTLTEADYVYMVDPWWNPSVERQAIDRAHRIGQKKQVFAYKMICRNTIEEKILILQQRKKQLAEDVISSEQGFVKNLTREDLEQLFSV